ncbi:MAG TPA: alpha/beta hydrolase [Dehalococcoidia bacterium]|nr:alpha/beta hydrolase [Dehalococcoidia bacterium]
MPVFQHDGATIYYEERGSGFPILTFAPAGLQSTIAVWNRPAAPLNPSTEFSAEYRVITLDQRNAGGQSHAPITRNDGWHSFASDHIALLDHLGIERCHLYGQCIGGPFIFSLLKAIPDRIAAAIIAQPIGRVGDLPPGRSASFTGWVEAVKPEAPDDVLDAYFLNLYGPGFAYSVDRAFVKSCDTPALVLAGNDAAHPFAIAEEIASLMPNAEFIPEWKEGDALTAAKQRMHDFLRRHTPPGAA